MNYPPAVIKAMTSYKKARVKLEAAQESLLEEIQAVAEAFSEHADSLESDDTDSATQSEIEELNGESDTWTDYLNSLPELDFSDEPDMPEIKS